ncbi:MAG TPA: adenylate/guanylate cyclase domain-containing protein, partial [Gemmatimonadaceae bacterium]|nr:adenylate/guanylate cyclase domain-containing protein [Gemmatimonadaceae bacterium]
LDINPSVSRTTITLVLAMAVIFAERRVRPYVDRAFFKERFALEQAMKELPERCAAVRKADDLWALAGAELVANVRPASCVVFVSAGDAFVPVFADGDTLPPAVGAGTELAGWIATLGGAARVDARSARIAGPTAAATLANFATVVVVPVHRGGALEAFITLGEKRSGDVYTHTDLTLLTALGKTLSSHMLRFDEAELLEQARRMQARMQRYVPGAIAAAIAEGAELESGEREVSVLFVDIRGYTAYADGRAVTDIFSTVNRYTETVSTIVNDGGGVVVEFNGDGMMAVFGAPRPLPQKERAAVATARRLAEAVPRLHADEPGAPPLTIGVGVATGPAFVGNIEAADRVIWSAIGSTTNLAARLQALTRDRNASVLVDETTHARAGDAGDGFTRHADVPIRGRKAPVTIFAL